MFHLHILFVTFYADKNGMNIFLQMSNSYMCCFLPINIDNILYGTTQK